MRAKHFFANAASKALALAATVMMMSAAFTSCSKDSDDDNGGLPTPKAQTVTIDGAEKPILKAEYKDNADGNYQFRLYLSADGKEKVKIDPVFTTGTLTMSGSPDGTINIVLKNGRVKGEDNKEHTLTINYSGSMTKVK